MYTYTYQQICQRCKDMMGSTLHGDHPSFVSAFQGIADPGSQQPPAGWTLISQLLGVYNPRVIAAFFHFNCTPKQPKEEEQPKNPSCWLDLDVGSSVSRSPIQFLVWSTNDQWQQPRSFATCVEHARFAMVSWQFLPVKSSFIKLNSSPLVATLTRLLGCFFLRQVCFLLPGSVPCSQEKRRFVSTSFAFNQGTALDFSYDQLQQWGQHSIMNEFKRKQCKHTMRVTILVSPPINVGTKELWAIMKLTGNL